MKETIVCIEGADYIRSKNPLLQRIILFLYKSFGVTPIYTSEASAWIERLKSVNREIINFDWPRSISPRDIKNSSKELARLLENKGNVRILASSLGTEVALRAAAMSGHVTRIIAVSGVYRPRKIDVPFVEIRSTGDHFANFFRKILRLTSFKPITSEIHVLDNITHDQFHKNILIESGPWKGRRISDVLSFFLDRA